MKGKGKPNATRYESLSVSGCRHCRKRDPTTNPEGRSVYSNATVYRGIVTGTCSNTGLKGVIFRK